jgi:hypothetical protein
MRTKLDKLLAQINPERTLEDTFNRANQAINTFRLDRARIEDHEVFEYTLAHFLRHVQAQVLRLSGPLDVPWEFYWSDCIHVLQQTYGPSGVIAAFEMARTGNEGGLSAVLRAVATRMAGQYAQNEIAARVNDYWNSLSRDEQFQAVSEYLEKYGRFLPGELTEHNAPRIRANFTKVLKEHPKLVQKIRRTVR